VEPHRTAHFFLTLGLIGAAIALMFVVRNPVVRRRLLFTLGVLVAAAGLHQALLVYPGSFDPQGAAPRIEGLLIAFAVAHALATLAFNPWTKPSGTERAPAIVQDAIIALLLIGVTLYSFGGSELLAGSAIVAAVVGFALQETLGNAFAGLAIQIDRPFKVGHWITVGGFEGTVRQITWRATKIWTKSGNMVILPNSLVAREAVSNYSEPAAPTRLFVEVGVGYQVPPNEAREALLSALRQASCVLKEPAPAALLWEFGGSALNFRVHFWVSDYSTEETARDEVRRAIYYELHRRNIEIPWPIQIEYSREEPPVDTPARRESFTRAIAAVPVFAGLPEDAHHALAAAATPRLFGKDEVIVREGAGGESMFLLLRGRVAILVGDPPRQVATTEAGGYFGEMSLLTGDPRTASVSALEDSQVIEIDAAAFKAYVTSHPAAIDQLADAAAARRRELDHTRVAAGAGRSPEAASIAMKMRKFFGL
jgi:small-conductance mechanosensitive channel